MEYPLVTVIMLIRNEAAFIYGSLGAVLRMRIRGRHFLNSDPGQRTWYVYGSPEAHDRAFEALFAQAEVK